MKHERYERVIYEAKPGVSAKVHVWVIAMAPVLVCCLALALAHYVSQR